MPLGPRDARRRRSRCLPCSKSHLKCDGTSPCANCAKSKRICAFPENCPGLISLQDPKHFAVLVRQQSNPRAALTNTEDRHARLFFNVFIPANRFAGNESSWQSSLRREFGTSRSLSRAVVAVGAFQAAKLSTSGRQQIAKEAFVAYAEATKALRRDIRIVTADHALCLVTTSFLLGLFELMCDATGSGWVTHTVHGTWKVLETLGPDGCRNEDVRDFFVETRVFEICRSVLFNTEGVLATQPWIEYAEGLLAERSVRNSQDAVLNTMTRCSSLCSRTLDFINSESPDCISGEYKSQMQGFANEGLALRSALQDLEAGLHPWDLSFSLEERLTALIYFHAISIYLSGIYDYDAVWSMAGVRVPELSQDLVCRHVESILVLVERALQKDLISVLLLLIPLRIAGARCWNKSQESFIRSSLKHIGRSFAVANTLARDLDEIWSRRLQ